MYLGNPLIYILAIMGVCGAIALTVAKSEKEDVLYDLLLATIGIGLGVCCVIAGYDLFVYVYEVLL